MRVITFTGLCLSLAASVASAQIQPQTMQPSETMAEPGPNWFMAVTEDAGYIFDASNGEMQGLITVSSMTPAVQPNLARHEFYAADSYYSRGSYGERTDILTIHDYENLSPIAEIDIPDKITILSFRGYIGLMSGGKYLGVFNMTPAQSISIVDVENRKFVGELSTPGCALILPVENNGFMNICGDGTLQLIRLDADGGEANRVRSKKFFDVQIDPVFDRPRPTTDGWLLVSNAGKAFDVTTSEAGIKISDAWTFMADEDEGWLPGGVQHTTVHKAFGLMYITMHEGEKYTHYQAGSEIWVIDIKSHRRIARIELESPAHTIMVTQETEPLLIVGDENDEIQVYDALKFTHERTINAPPSDLFEDL
jgi:methylamine dehydrogenase heavy chain